MTITVYPECTKKFKYKKVNKERKKITLTMKLYKYRLGVMLDSYAGNLTGNLTSYCPAKLGFSVPSHNIKLPIILKTWKNDPCAVCLKFMEISTDICPCGYYGYEKAAKFAYKKLNKLLRRRINSKEK